MGCVNVAAVGDTLLQWFRNNFARDGSPLTGCHCSGEAGLSQVTRQTCRCLSYPDWGPSNEGTAEREIKAELSERAKEIDKFMDDTDTRRDSSRDQRTASPRAVRSSPADSGTPQATANPPSGGVAPAGVIEDPFADLTPAERFARALERRDAVILKLSQGSRRS